jgi:HPt (histidine-containing phosphotransfer) domain-containing protein
MSNLTDPAGPAIESVPNVLDVSVFQELVESLQAEVAAAVYRKFIENAAAFIGGLSEQNTDECVETFHTLKGSAAMVGANRLAQLAAQLQTQASSVQVEAPIQQLKSELEAFRVEVASRLLALGASLDTSR